MKPDDIDDELRFHVDSRVSELMAEGWSRANAVSRAEAELGDRAAVQASCQQIARAAGQAHSRRRYWIGVVQDLSYASRSLQRSASFSVATIAVLALGIGLTTAVVAALYGIIYSPLPYPDSENLHQVYAVNTAKDLHESPMSAADFYTLRDRLPGEVRIGGYMSWPVSLTGVAEPERLRGALATADLFTTLGVAPVEGRTFVADDERPGREVAIISARLAARLGLTGRAAGASIQLANAPVTIVGVMPHGFDFPEADTEVWIPLALSAADRANHESRWLHTVARFDANALPQVQGRLNSVMAGLAADRPASNAGWDARAVPLRQVVVGDAGPTVKVLSLLILCVMLVTVVNVIALVVARLHRRQAELALHQALGAGLWRLSRQLSAEALLLSMFGGGLGLLLAGWLTGLFRRLAPGVIPRAAEVSVSQWPLVFASAVAALLIVAMTVIPLWLARGANLGLLTAGGRGAVATRTRFSRVVVATQAAFAALLVVTAGLLAQAFIRLSTVDLGFAPANVLTLRISLPRSMPLDGQRAYFAGVLDRIRSVPGVTGAGATNDLPLSGNSPNVPILVDGREPSPGDPELRADFRVITPGYLETVGSAVRGRPFTDRDTPGAPPVALVNDALARRQWPGQDAIGQRIRTSADTAWRTVVGVVRDVHHGGLNTAEGPAIYIPHAQKAEAWMTWMSMAVRTTDSPMTKAAAVRAAIASVDRNQPVSDVMTLSQLVSDALALPRLAAAVAAAVSLIALLLAAFGTGAVLSRLIAARIPEFGLRLALGANPARLAWTPVWEVVRLVGAGSLAGLLVAAGSSRLLAGLLHDVSPFDGPTYAVALAVIVMTGVAAAIGPAMRVARIAPVIALRE